MVTGYAQVGRCYYVRTSRTEMEREKGKDLVAPQGGTSGGGRKWQSGTKKHSYVIIRDGA